MKTTYKWLHKYMKFPSIKQVFLEIFSGGADLILILDWMINHISISSYVFKLIT